MHDWLKKNKKKVLAVVGTFLMVAFLAPTMFSNNSGRIGPGARIGKLGKTVLYESDRRRAAAIWKLLEGSYSVRLLREREEIFKAEQDIRDQYKQFPGFADQIIQMQRQQGRLPTPPPTVSPILLLDPVNPRRFMAEIKDHPELLLLLVKEADQRGISIPPDRLRSAMKNEILQDPQTLGNEVAPEAYEEAVLDFLKIQALHDLIVNDAKYTEAEWDRAFTENFRVERLNRVEYPANVAALKVPPTTQQVQALYDQFKNVDPDDPDKPANDPLGFGYFQPTHVKVQYLTVARKDVLAYFKSKISDKSGLKDEDLLLSKKAWDEYFGKNKESYGLEYDAQQLDQQASQIQEQAQPLLGAMSAAAASIAKAAQSDARRASTQANSAQRSARDARDAMSEDSAFKSIGEAGKAIDEATKAIETAKKELALAAEEAAKPITTQPSSTQPSSTTKPSHPTTGPATRPAAAHPTTAPASSFDSPPPCGDPTILAFATEPTTSPAVASASATQPTTGPSSTTAPVAAPTSGPATTQSADRDDKIFEQLSDEIIGAGLKAEIDKMEADVAQAIHDKMLEDWHAHSTATSAPAVPHDSPEYLSEVQRFTQGLYKILPQTTQLSGWYTARQAQQLPGVGSAVALETNLYGELPFFKVGLSVWEPSQVIKDGADAHVFRFTAISPAHPKDLNEVTYPLAVWSLPWGPAMHPTLDKVTEDAKLNLAYDQAKATAQQLVERVKSGQTLTKAARADGKQPTLTEYFSRDSAQTHHISPEVAAEAEKLLAKASDKDPNPMGVIELPATREVLVVQLDHVMLQIPEQIRDRVKSLDVISFHQRLRQTAEEQVRTGGTLADSYFNFDAVSKRVGYQLEAAKSGS